VYNADWSHVLGSEQNPNKLLISLNNFLTVAFNESFPLKRLSKKRAKDKDWFTKSLIVSSNNKQILYKNWLKSQNPADKEKYLNYNRIFKKTCKNAENVYYQELFNKKTNSIRNIWAEINKLTSTAKKKTAKINYPDKFLINGVNITDKLDIANHFNQYFCSVGELTSTKAAQTHLNYRDFLKVPIKNTMFCAPIDPVEVFNQIIETKKSSQIDLLNINILKQIAPCISEQLAYIFNKSLDQGIFPPKSLKLLGLSQSIKRIIVI
jgi:hypothetical protein